jgi:ethanolamine utilization protein EutP (predicted NTPase)
MKARYRSLTTKGKSEFVYAFSQLVLLQRKYANIELYFASPSEEELQRARLQFFDRYLKDDYLDEVVTKLQLKESQIRSFRSSLEAVAKSGRFNLDHLKRFVAKRREYRKLFIVTSDTNLPQPVQTYIRQNPHFILNWASIANLPRIGLSKRFDIFFFSPREPITSAAALLTRLSSLSNALHDHPIRIYAVDPIEGVGSSIARNPHFQQAISFFEEGTIDTSTIHELTYEQILALFENSNVPLLDLIREIPPAEFSSSITTPEKDALNSLFTPSIKTHDGMDVFRAISRRKAILSKARAMKTVPQPYLLPELHDQLGGSPTLPRVRTRLLTVSEEVLTNLASIDKMLP